MANKMAAQKSVMTAPGVIGKAGKYFIGASEVKEYIGCKDNKAYEIIRGLRKELIDSGQLFPGLPQGVVPRKYFMKRMMIDDDE